MSFLLTSLLLLFEGIKITPYYVVMVIHGHGNMEKRACI